MYPTLANNLLICHYGYLYTFKKIFAVHTLENLFIKWDRQTKEQKSAKDHHSTDKKHKQAVCLSIKYLSMCLLKTSSVHKWSPKICNYQKATGILINL